MDAPDVFPPAGPHILADENSAAGGQAGDQAGNGLHHLTAGGDRRDPRRVGKPPYNHQVGGTVEELKKGGPQEGQGKFEQGTFNISADQGQFLQWAPLLSAFKSQYSTAAAGKGNL